MPFQEFFLHTLSSCLQDCPPSVLRFNSLLVLRCLLQKPERHGAEEGPPREEEAAGARGVPGRTERKQWEHAEDRKGRKEPLA